MKNKVLTSLLFYFFLGAEAFAASGTGSGDFLATLNTVQNWVKAASVALAFILIVIGGLRTEKRKQPLLAPVFYVPECLSDVPVGLFPI